MLSGIGERVGLACSARICLGYMLAYSTCVSVGKLPFSALLHVACFSGLGLLDLSGTKLWLLHAAPMTGLSFVWMSALCPTSWLSASGAPLALSCLAWL